MTDATISEGGRRREHLSSAQAASSPDPGSDDISTIRAFIGSWPKDTVGHDLRAPAVAALKRVAARLAQTEQERDEAEGAMKVWRNRTMAAEARAERSETALREIAGLSPRSQRPEVEQLRDAVKWRQGIARDALAGPQAEEQT